MGEPLVGKTADEIYAMRILSQEEYEHQFPFGSQRELSLGAAAYLVGAEQGSFTLSHVYPDGGSVWSFSRRFAIGCYEKGEIFITKRRAQKQLDIEYGMRVALVD